MRDSFTRHPNGPLGNVLIGDAGSRYGGKLAASTIGAIDMNIPFFERADFTILEPRSPAESRGG